MGSWNGKTSPSQVAGRDCGGRLRLFGEDIAEILEYIPANFKVIRHVRPKSACNKCKHVVQAPEPSRTIERRLAGPGLIAHVLVSKYADYCPLFRQSEIYAREGVDLDRSTLAGWVGASSELLAPLVEALRKPIGSRALHQSGQARNPDVDVDLLVVKEIPIARVCRGWSLCRLRDVPKVIGGGCRSAERWIRAAVL